MTPSEESWQKSNESPPSRPRGFLVNHEETSFHHKGRTPDQHTYEACQHENRTPEEHTYEGLHSGVSAEQSAYVVIDNRENLQDISVASSEGKHTSEKCFLHKHIRLMVGIGIGFAVVLIISVTCSIIFSCKYYDNKNLSGSKRSLLQPSVMILHRGWRPRCIVVSQWFINHLKVSSLFY